MNLDGTNIDDIVNYEEEYGKVVKKSKIQGSKMTGCCPFHNDKNPSFSVDLENGKWICFAGCGSGNYVDLVAKLNDISTKEAYKKILRDNNIEQPKKKNEDKYKPYTVEQYCGDKKIPVDFLKKKFYVSDATYCGTQCVKMPYLTEDGTEHRCKMRFANKQQCYNSGPGKGLILYGEWLLPEIRKDGYVFLVEGESDTQSLWYMGLPALGVPGVEGFNAEMAEKLKGIEDIYIHCEGDAAGNKFAFQTVPKRLKEVGYSGTVGVLKCRDIESAIKDPSDLLIKYGKDDARNKISELLINNTEQIDLSENEEIDLSGIEEAVDLDKFHKFDKRGEPYEIIDGEIAEYLVHEKLQMFVFGGIPYIYENGYYKKDESGTRLMSEIKKCIYINVVTAPRVCRVYKLILQDDSIQKEYNEINKYPARWINFKNGMYDPINDKLLDHDPKYLSTVQIPHEYKNIAETFSVSKTLSAFLGGIFPDEKDKMMFLQYCGYCMTRDTSLQKFLIIVGAPRSGKSTVINLLAEALGRENISNISLQDLNKRFYPAQLLGKLANICADLPKTALESVDQVKKITGEDEIMGEYKGGKIFGFKPFSKLLFSTNQMPISMDEKSAAFFRRILLIEVKGQGEYICNIEEKLKESIPAFIALCVAQLRALYKNQKDRIEIDSPNSKKLVHEYHRQCDSVMAFLDDMITEDKTKKIGREELYSIYKRYCEKNEWPPLSNRGFYSNMRGKGFYDTKSHGTYIYKGLILKESGFMAPTQEERKIIPFS